MKHRNQPALAVLIAILLVGPSSHAGGWNYGTRINQKESICQGSCGGGCGPCSGDTTREYIRDDDRAERQEEERLRQERNASYDAIRTKVSAAWTKGDYREALRLLREQQELRDGPNVRASIAMLEKYFADKAARETADVAREDATAAYNRGDWRAALVLYRRALATDPDALSDFGKQRLKDLDERLKNETDAADQERRHRPEVERLRAEAKAMVDLRPADALAKLDAALKLLPGDARTTGDWWLTTASLALREARYDDAIQAMQNAQNFVGDSPELAKARTLVTDERNRQGVNVQNAFGDLRQRLSAVPDTATSVVDARVPPTGANLVAQVPELKNSPAADRITKGFSAVMNRDWPVALAWWQEALQRDPTNAALKRSVDLAQWMVDRRQPAGRVTPINAAINTASRGDYPNAIRQLELAKAGNPAVAAQADRVIAAIRARSAQEAKVAANQDQEIKESARELYWALIDRGMGYLVTGMDQAAEQAFNDAEFFGMGVSAKDKNSRPDSGNAPAPESSKLDFIRN